MKWKALSQEKISSNSFVAHVVARIEQQLIKPVTKLDLMDLNCPQCFAIMTLGSDIIECKKCHEVAMEPIEYAGDMVMPLPNWPQQVAEPDRKHVAQGGE